MRREGLLPSTRQRTTPDQDRDVRDFLRVLEHVDDILLTSTSGGRAADMTLELRSDESFVQ